MKKYLLSALLCSTFNFSVQAEDWTKQIEKSFSSEIYNLSGCHDEVCTTTFIYKLNNIVDAKKGTIYQLAKKGNYNYLEEYGWQYVKDLQPAKIEIKFSGEYNNSSAEVPLKNATAYGEKIINIYYGYGEESGWFGVTFEPMSSSKFYKLLNQLKEAYSSDKTEYYPTSWDKESEGIIFYNAQNDHCYTDLVRNPKNSQVRLQLMCGL